MIKYFEDILNTIEKSIKSLNEEKFIELLSQCVQVLNNNGKIIASGLGKNVPICEKFVGTLNSLGVNAAFLHTNTAMHGDLGVIKKDDLVLLLTKSGNTSESIVLAQHLLERGTNVWLISFNEKSELNEVIKNSIILDLEHEGDAWDIMPNNSTSVYLILLQGLAMKIREELGITLEEFKMNHPGGSIGRVLNGDI